DDADVDAAAAAGAWGSFRHAGQICMATGRHLVHESVAEHYVDVLARRAESLQVGDPVRSDADIGPLIDGSQCARVHDLVTRSVDAGARLVAGGTYEGPFYRPTVLADVPLDDQAFLAVNIGPVAPHAPCSYRDYAVYPCP